jgi:hypothetical protein
MLLAPPRGPAIDVFNFGGGRCRKSHQHPPGGPQSTPSTSVEAAVGPADSTSQGARHRRLQLRWWPQSDMLPAPARGPVIDVSLGTCRQNFSGDTYQGGHCGEHYYYRKIAARLSTKNIFWVLRVPRTRESYYYHCKSSSPNQQTSK